MIEDLTRWVVRSPWRTAASNAVIFFVAWMFSAQMLAWLFGWPLAWVGGLVAAAVTWLVTVLLNWKLIVRRRRARRQEHPLVLLMRDTLKVRPVNESDPPDRFPLGE